MTPFIQLITDLFIIILLAKFAGWVSTRVGQPSVLGELIVGLILGLSFIDITHLWFVTDVHLSEIINELGELGVQFLMFIAGLEHHFSDLARNTNGHYFPGSLASWFQFCLNEFLDPLMG
jgi:Kef-type K+ transport system membrane component KefB